MNNQAFSKIWILIILIVLIGGGFLAWQYRLEGLKKLTTIQNSVPEITKEEPKFVKQGDVITIIPASIIQSNGKNTIVVKGNIGGMKGPGITATIKMDIDTKIFFFKECDGNDELYATRTLGPYPNILENLVKRLPIKDPAEEPYGVRVVAQRITNSEFKGIVIIVGFPGEDQPGGWPCGASSQ